MDNGPFRMRNSAGVGRTTANRPAATSRSVASEPAEPVQQPIEASPLKPPVHRSSGVSHHRHEEPKKSKLKLILAGIAAIVVIILALTGWMLLKGGTNTSDGIDSGKYQAVFFTNGQVYFGKLHSFNDQYMKLTDIYYLQSQQAADSDKDSKNPQQTSTDQSNVQLIKLGDEIHGPEDNMIISKDQMLFYENLKSDGKVAQSIQKFKGSH
jgi:hypothetical protein